MNLTSNSHGNKGDNSVKLSSARMEKNFFEDFDVSVNDDDNYHCEEACAKEADADVEVEVEGNNGDLKIKPPKGLVRSVVAPAKLLLHCQHQSVK